jgi:hypothetical protein
MLRIVASCIYIYICVCVLDIWVRPTSRLPWKEARLGSRSHAWTVAAARPEPSSQASRCHPCCALGIVAMTRSRIETVSGALFIPISFTSIRYKFFPFVCETIIAMQVERRAVYIDGTRLTSEVQISEVFLITFASARLGRWRVHWMESYIMWIKGPTCYDPKPVC